MGNFIASVNTTLPLIIMLAVGYFLGRIGFIKSDFIKQANKLNYWVFLPCSVFAGTYCKSVDFSEGLSVVITEVIIILVTFVLGYFISRTVTKDISKRGTVMVSLCRSNYVYIGTPVVCAIFGLSSSIYASLVVAVLAVVCNIISPFCFTVNSGEKVSGKTLLKSVFANTYIIASIIAVILMICHCPQFPEPIHKSIATLGNVCTPLALITLGASFDFKSAGTNKKLLIWANFFKLLVFPIIGTLIIVALGFRGEALAALFVYLACPTATVIFTIAQAYGGDSELASEIVVTQTVVSMVTMTLGIFILKTLGLF